MTPRNNPGDQKHVLINRLDLEIRSLCLKAKENGLSGPTFHVDIFDRNNTRVFETEVVCSRNGDFSWEREYPVNNIGGLIEIKLTGENGRSLGMKFDASETETGTPAPTSAEKGAEKTTSASAD